MITRQSPRRSLISSVLSLGAVTSLPSAAGSAALRSIFSRKRRAAGRGIRPSVFYAARL